MFEQFFFALHPKYPFLKGYSASLELRLPKPKTQFRATSLGCGQAVLPLLSNGYTGCGKTACQ